MKTYALSLLLTALRPHPKPDFHLFKVHQALGAAPQSSHQEAALQGNLSSMKTSVVTTAQNMWQEFSRCNIWQQTFLAFQLTSACKNLIPFAK